MVEHMVDTPGRRGHVEIRTGVGGRRRWTDEEKGRIVAEAVSPGVVVADVARRHELTPQHLFTWIRAAKAGELALPAETVQGGCALAEANFVPVVVEPAETPKPAPSRERTCAIEIAIGSIKVRVHNNADTRTIEAVLRAVKQVAA